MEIHEGRMHAKDSERRRTLRSSISRAIRREIVARVRLILVEECHESVILIEMSDRDASGSVRTTVLKIIRILNLDRDHSYRFVYNAQSRELLTFIEADWGGGIESRKYTSCYTGMTKGGPIST